MITAHSTKDIQSNFKKVMTAFLVQDLINLQEDQMLTLLTKPNVGIAWSIKTGGLLMVPTDEVKGLDEFIYITDGFADIDGNADDAVTQVVDALYALNWYSWVSENPEKYELLVNDIVALPHLMVG